MWEIGGFRGEVVFPSGGLLIDLPCHRASLHATSRVLGVIGSVAQLVEQGIENPCVGGSIPSRATSSSEEGDADVGL